MGNTLRHACRRRGQAVVEYVLLLFFVVGALFVLFKMMPRFLAKLETPITKDYKYTYKYGDPKARGFEDEGGGAPTRHPRVYRSGNFKLFGRGD